jgi:hypothetical protein
MISGTTTEGRMCRATSAAAVMVRARVVTAYRLTVNASGTRPAGWSKAPLDGQGLSSVVYGASSSCAS